MHERYTGGVIPKLDEAIDIQLFNTLRSMIPHEQRPVDLTLHTDERGSLFEAVKADGGGQAFLSSTKPGITRGNHFHTRKVERFLVLKGTAEIRIRRVLTDNVHTFNVDGRTPQAIDIPTLHTHNITNTGNEELQTLFWSNELYDPADPDTYYETV